MAQIFDGLSVVHNWLVQGGIANPRLRLLVAEMRASGVAPLTESNEDFAALIRGVGEFSTYPLHRSEAERLGTRRTCLGDFVHDELSDCQHHNINIVGAGATQYPYLLKQIPAAPFALYVLGSMRFCASAVAIVGARKATGDAIAISYHLADTIAAAGGQVISGGALGCDIAAHAGAVRSPRSGSTVCVQAGGLGALFPRRNQHVFQRMLAGGGAFISERPLHARPKPYSFPVRNRIIAGLVESVVLVQAAERSGAAITATMAADYGRDVYVYDGPCGDVRFERNHQLILAGGQRFRLVEELEDLARHRCALRGDRERCDGI